MQMLIVLYSLWQTLDNFLKSQQLSVYCVKHVSAVNATAAFIGHKHWFLTCRNNGSPAVVHCTQCRSSQHVINVIGNNAAHWSFLSETDHTRSSAVPVRYSMTRRRAFISSIVITDTTTKYATCCLASQSSTFTCRKGYPTSHAPLVIYANLYSPITW